MNQREMIYLSLHIILNSCSTFSFCCHFALSFLWLDEKQTRILNHIIKYLTLAIKLITLSSTWGKGLVYQRQSRSHVTQVCGTSAIL